MQYITDKIVLMIYKWLYHYFIKPIQKNGLESGNYIKCKVTKSTDYSLLYLDFFNYKYPTMKYFSLDCPYILYLSGEGNYLRPFYICESDTFI